MRLNDGTVQIIVRDGKVMVVAMNLGGGEMSFADDDGDNADFSFQVVTLMAGMEFVLRMHGSTPQALDFDAPPSEFVKPYGLTETPEQTRDRTRKLTEHYTGARTVDFPPPPKGL